ncbi:2'-5' RNA ligase family protein [Streptomyces millisiae]|uniref:2'-5' RNA ligase family protein n=1 Tax=Streptomyces millisiae TaxID=3075542 RepID=A0ABU2LPL8_9ACTN|nr:2'-5' RNA ligase family protein [Streptomyces sp. DSM 44918]MDT0319538.1 2'-5' RNA ligase family protein [Streptomyces sp. DSM 44918]
MPYRVGETALLVVVEAAEPVVGGWRRRFDRSAAAGVPAHVTVLVPFLDVARIDDGVLGELRQLFAAHRPFDVRFEGFGRFPDVLYLAPEPAGPVRALTEAVVARWPEVPPYGGAFAEVVPHLTVAHGQVEDVYREAEAALAGRLPLGASVHAVELWGSDGDRWRRRARFPLLAAR